MSGAARLLHLGLARCSAHGDKPATFRILRLTKQKSSVSLFVSNQGQKEVEWGSIRITYLVDHTTG
jgi:hypothetical protein